ncbi:MAG: YfcE family phosphodiesterase [Planctomycetia bacterium]|nr:YfcE family phosphodiesterase [Planctomycetia bacterium]
MSSLGIISDTHNNVSRLIEALSVFADYGVSRVIHCGDITTPETVRYFAQIPTSFVFGNNDFHKLALSEETAQIGAESFDTDGVVQWQGRHVYFTHGDRISLLRTNLDSGNWDVVCSGHTHCFSVSYVGATLALNPGAATLGSFCILQEDLSVLHFVDGRLA